MIRELNTLPNGGKARRAEGNAFPRPDGDWPDAALWWDEPLLVKRETASK